MTATAIIAAAGSGERVGGHTPKQFLLILGKPVLIHTLQAFEKVKGIDQMVVVLPKTELSRLSPDVQKQYKLTKKITVVSGGLTRQASVQCGLEAIRWNPDAVVIHDAARCLITPRDIQKTIDSLSEWDGAVLATPMKDTLKRVDGRKIQETISRKNIWAMQTPQTFKYATIVKAYQMAGERELEATDDAQVTELLKANVCVMEGSSQNFKITYEEDLRWAELLLKGRAK